MYPNPYLMSTIPKAGILSKTLQAVKTIKWANLLEGTQKTLGVINQAIPIVYQIKPIVNNAKTIFKIADSIRSSDSQNTISEEEAKKEEPQPIKKESPSLNNSPIFYI